MRGFFPKREFRPGSSSTWPPTSNPVITRRSSRPNPTTSPVATSATIPLWATTPAVRRRETRSPAGRPLLALELPKFDDGRALTQARVLRERLGCRGDLCAVGDILQYLVFVARRCGSNGIQPCADQNLDNCLHVLQDFSTAYQPAADAAQSAFIRRRQTLANRYPIAGTATTLQSCVQ